MQSQKYYYCNIEGLTDVGCKRPANEDWFDKFECRNGLVAVVCDGMGGHVGGAVASHTAVEAIRAFLENNYFDNPNEAIISAVNAGNQAILQRTQQQPELAGMGATCVILLVRDGYVYYGVVGDSRIYLVRQHGITQLTKDQSYVQMLVDRGDITPQQAEHHPRKNEITNALGLAQMMPAVVNATPVEPEAGDCFILCSDGLSGMVPDEKILEIAGNQVKMTQMERVQALIEKARANGGLDNITAVMVEFSLSPFKKKKHSAQDVQNTTPPKPSRLLKLWVPLAVLCLAVIGGAAWWFLRDSEARMAKGEDYIKEIQEKEKNAQFPLRVEGTDSIPVFRAGRAFMTVEEFPAQMGTTIISWLNAKGDTMKVKGPDGLLSTLVVNPVENVVMKKAGPNKVVLEFKEKIENFAYVALVFKNKDGRSLHYTFNILIPEVKDVLPQPRKKSDVKKDADRVKEAIKEEGRETPLPGTPVSPAKTIEINERMANNKGEINISLQTGEGRSSNANIYVGKDVKFSTQGNKVKEAAYQMSCPNENVVNITIHYAEFRKEKETISIFLADQREYVLTVIKK